MKLDIVWESGLMGNFQCFRVHSTASPFFWSHYYIKGAEEDLTIFVNISDNCEGQKW